MSNKILVIGSTGKTGSRVYNRLQNKNIHVRPASRNSEIPFDWYNEATWARALEGITTIYITFQPDLAVPGSLSIITNFTKAAKVAGINKLVLLSGRGEAEAEACERVIQQSGMAWTIVRASFFMQNFNEGFWADGITAKEFLIPITKTKEPFVDADDIADVVVEALLDSKHDGKTYELTGPELLSFQEVINNLSIALKTDIQLIQVPIDEYKAILKTYDVPEEVIWLIAYLFSEVLDGRNESVKNDIELVLNRKPASLKNYIEKAIKAGFWKNQ